MDQQYNGGSWMMIPPHNSMNNQDDFSSLSSQFIPQQNTMPLQHQQLQQQPQTSQQAPQHPSLSSHFSFLPLVEKLAEAIDSGNRDQHYETLVTELTNQFKRCQQLLDSISEKCPRSMTVEEQRRLLEETKQQLNQRRELIAKYRSRVEDLVNQEQI